MSTRLPRLVSAALAAAALSLSAGVGSAGASLPTSPAIVSGQVTELGGSWFTLQTAGRRVGVINALSTAATQITSEDTPYVWGGGHAEAGVASAGGRRSAHTAKPKGFDCSGAVTAVLAGAGLWPSGTGVPADNGVISELLSEHLIARGVGSAPEEVTLYDDPGVHIFMNIDGRFFGTSDGGGGGDAAGGAGWLDDGAYDASSPAYQAYHFLPPVLAQKTSYSAELTFQLPAGGLSPGAPGGGLSLSPTELSVPDLVLGERLRVAYTSTGTGAMVLASVGVISGAPTPSAPMTTSAPTTTSTPAVAAPVPISPVSSNGSSSGGAGYGSRPSGGMPLG